MTTAFGQARARSVQTTVPCLVCGGALSVVRSCQNVQAHCVGCDRVVEIGEVIARADEAMELFLENIYCDRM